LLLYVAASLALLIFGQHPALTTARSVLAVTLYPLQQLVSMPNKTLDMFKETFVSYRTMARENERLREEDTLLKARLLKLDALEQETLRLRALIDSSVKLGEQYLIAELLHVRVSPHEQVIVVNRGSRYGVYPGQAVINAKGVAGQVLRVTPFTADVVLMTDSSHAIPVQVNRSGVRTIAQGTGRAGWLALPYLEPNADVKPGDLLITSGLGGVFPEGYPVATVADASSTDAPQGSLVAIPVAELDQTREFLIVWSQPEPAASAQLPSAPQNKTGTASPHETR
jgi:rod shape-determining protein MreC